MFWIYNPAAFLSRVTVTWHQKLKVKIRLFLPVSRIPAYVLLDMCSPVFLNVSPQENVDHVRDMALVQDGCKVKDGIKPFIILAGINEKDRELVWRDLV